MDRPSFPGNPVGAIRNTSRVNTPVGGYVVATVVVFSAFLFVVGAIHAILEGEVIPGLGVLVIVVPMSVLVARDAVYLNADVRYFREWLRVNYWGLYVGGRYVRLGFVGVVLLGGLGNVIYLGGSWVSTLAVAGAVLLSSSMASVYLSALFRWVIR